MDNLNDYKDLAHQSYSDNGQRKSSVGDWNQIGGSRHVGVYQNKKTGEINQAISGSRSISDFISDGFLALLGVKDHNYRKRDEEAKEMARRIERIKGSNSHTVSGHSLGGNLTNDLIHNRLANKGTTFNSFVTHHDYKKARHHNITNVRNKGDLASILTRNNSNTVNLDSKDNKYSNISNHFLDNLIIPKK